MNMLCQPDAGGAEEEAILEPIILVGLGSKGVSRMTKGTVVGARGELKGTSLGCSKDLVVSCGLLRPRGAGGRGACC